MRHISAKETQARLQESETSVTLLDCREPMEVEIASIAGAVHIPMSQIPARLEELDLDGEIIVFCHSGIRSQDVAGFLEEQGFTQVLNMLGGIDAWSHEVDPRVPRY